MTYWWCGLVAALLAAGGCKARPVGTMACSAIMADSVLARMADGTPTSTWLHGFVAARIVASAKPGTPLPHVTLRQDQAHWQAVVAVCRSHPSASLAAAAVAAVNDPRASAEALRDTLSSFWNGDENTGSEAEDDCGHLARIDALVPGHSQEALGPWLDGYGAGVASTRPGLGIAEVAKASPAWTLFAGYCQSHPDQTLLQAAAAVVPKTPG